MGVLRRIFDLYWQDNFLNNKIQSDKDNFLDNLIYEIAIIGVLGSIFRQDNFLTIYERFWHLGGHVCWNVPNEMCQLVGYRFLLNPII